MFLNASFYLTIIQYIIRADTIDAIGTINLIPSVQKKSSNIQFVIKLIVTKMLFMQVIERE